MEKEPIADRFIKEIGAFSRLWNEHLILAICLLLIAAIIVGYTIYNGIKSQGTIQELKSENADLRRDNRMLESEIKGLRETVAPLLKQAAKEFPGKEINSSLKKLIEKLEHENPIKKPISTATTTVEVTVESDEQINTTYGDRGGYFVICKGDEALLVTSATQCRARQTGNGEVIYRGIFNMDATDSAVGREICFLRDAEYMQIEFFPIKEHYKIITGRAIFIVNNSVRYEFLIPGQITEDKKIYIRDIQEFKKMLSE